jgi:retron-type reverse transcriptase
MKRHGHLWPRVISLDNLLAAAAAARRRKRARPAVARFEFHLETELLKLQRELVEQCYVPGPYREFRIFEPKERWISAAPYRDRVVHHALVRVLEPIFERIFISDSYACRPERGTHRAIDRCQQFARRFRYVWKADIRQFFPSIDHQVLKAELGRKLKDPQVLWLIDRILDGSGGQKPDPVWFPGDHLLTPLERRCGLPLGNQTSQFFANVFLDGLDHFVKDQLGVAGYLRYVDDFALFADDKTSLWNWRQEVIAFLATLRLRVHPRKDAIFPVDEGIRFLGFRIFPDHRRLNKDNVWRFLRRLRGLQMQFQRGEVNLREVRQRIQSWIAHASHADTWRLRRSIFAAIVFDKGGG